MLIFLLNQLDAQDSFSVQGRVVEVLGDTTVGVAYATLMSPVDAYTGAVADAQGYFTLYWKGSATISLAVHALGYADTVVYISADSESPEIVEIKLVKKPILLHEIVIPTERLYPELWGRREARFLMKKDGNLLTIKVNKPGVANGNGYYTGGRTGIIDAIGIYFTEQQVGSEFLLEVYQLSGKFEDYRLYDMKLLQPLINSPVVLKAERKGWLSFKPEEAIVFSGCSYVVVCLIDIHHQKPLLPDETTDVTYFDYGFLLFDNNDRNVRRLLRFDDSFSLLHFREAHIFPMYLEVMVSKKK